MSQSFLGRLRDYLNERLKDEGPYKGLFKPFKIDMPSSFPGEKWMVRCEEGGIAAVMNIAESFDGTISVYSCRTDRGGEYIHECLLKSYRYRFKKAEAKGREEEEKVWKVFREEKKRAREDYINRRNFEKHLKKSYKEAFIRLLWFDGVAKRISEEYGVEVKLTIAKDSDCGSCLVSRFNSKGMSDEEKLEEIKKRVEAITAACRLAQGAYEIGYPPELQREYRRKYQEFRRAILEKYVSKSAKKLENPCQ
ncbi:MAG: hypothetical protein ACPL4E_10400 [Thermoproteota archaeon]